MTNPYRPLVVETPEQRRICELETALVAIRRDMNAIENENFRLWLRLNPLRYEPPFALWLLAIVGGLIMHLIVAVLL